MRRITARTLALLGLWGAVTAAAQTAAPTPAAKPCSAPEFRQLDFWVGEWEVRTTDGGQPAGRSRIERILGGCVVAENWTGQTKTGTYEGKSFNMYRADLQQWEQVWVDEQGTFAVFRGVWRDGALRYEREEGGKPGTKSRMTFFALPAGTVRQLGESSSDGGKTWKSTFDLTYRRKARG